MLPLQVALTLLAFVAAAALLLTGSVAAIAGYHLIFAVGILPLILAAMTHFMPVLARCSPAGRRVRLIPAAALPGGLLAVLYFTYPQLAPTGHLLGAGLAGSAVAALAAWAWRLRAKAIGAPHPCLDWYLAALACLLLGLGAILAGHWLPGQRATLRLLHLHLNTLGFIGITALGTLQVLLPTAAQQPDPGVAARMRRLLKWSVAGVLAAAGAAAWQPALAWIGALLLAIPPAAIAGSWLRRYRGAMFAPHGAIPSLSIALCGYGAVLLLGTVHGLFGIPFNLVAAFLVAFLLPLVTGAASYLLPLWLRPGRQTEWHRALRGRLGYGSAARGLIMFAGGLLAGMGFAAGWIPALFVAGAFAVQVLLALALP